MRIGINGAVLLSFMLATGAVAAEKKPKTEKAANASPWAEFIEPDFPFISSVLDARKLGNGLPEDNLTPRGLILRLGNDAWACFDTDLLRMSVIWTGKGVTPVSMSQGSYHTAGEKAPEGQGKLPEIIGTPWLANGIYPGWQASEGITTQDPREPAPDKREVGRGPIAPALGQFKAVRLTQSGARLEYTVAGVGVREWVESRVEDGQTVVQRRFELERVRQPVWLLLGRKPTTGAENFKAVLTTATDAKAAVGEIQERDGVLVVRLSPQDKPVRFTVAMGMLATVRSWNGSPATDAPPALRWPQKLTTHGTLSSAKDAYVNDSIALPTDNPWKRNVRFADMAFFKDGRAAAVTFDGDVWVISGLIDDLKSVTWKRFASGLHEPLGLAIRNEEVYVFDRNGIWRLRDTDGNGEADVHELFSNAFAQTAETREFASGLRAAPDGSFVIAKGGQQGSTTGKQNGMVLRVAADGQSVTEIGWGLRQPFIGINPKTGVVTASDQQGNYVPATPLHFIHDHMYYGFISLLLPKEKYPAPITDPLTWIPHPINASGAGQVWLTDAKMGPLNDALIHIGYYRPEVFVVLLNQRTSRTQASVVSLTRDMDFAPLNGAVNPVDGQLYVIGFQIWGTVAKDISGLMRIRYTGAPSTLPREVTPMDKGVLVRFDAPLDAKQALDAGNFSAERWVYQRTAAYGSPHFKPDGSKGQEAMAPSSVYLSKDGKSVFIGIPDMKPVMQMRFGWSLALASAPGKTFAQNAYFTPYELVKFDPVAEGFEAVTVDLTPKQIRSAAETPVTLDEGKRLYELMGCIACHSNDGSTLGKVGPSWKGLFSSQVTLTDGKKVLADEAYLRESIKEPAAKIVKGYDKSDAGMPSYEGVINDAQIEALILYIKSLK